jgi:hypothetical protein
MAVGFGFKSDSDPTGISQGSAGAVFILSKISGDDKCKYAVFSGMKQLQNTKKTEKQMMHVYSRYAGEQRCQTTFDR